MQQNAKVCETIAEDKTQESLTGESNEKEMNEQDAKVWQGKIQSLAGSRSHRAGRLR